MILTESVLNEMKKTFINYCEGIITPDGDFRIAKNGHINELILATGENYDVIFQKMPINAAPLFWLCMYTNSLVVNYDYTLCTVNITSEQKKAYKSLVKHRLIKDNLKTVTRW